MNLQGDSEIRWKQLAGKYTNNASLVTLLWAEIEQNYSSAGRYYHTLEHIGKLLKIFEAYKGLINDRDAVEFAIWYHDIIYAPGQTDNETESAGLAEKRMRELGVGQGKITTIVHLIEATKSHQLNDITDNFDGRFFLDADLSILGAEWSEYELYTQQIRKEFGFVDENAYAAG